MTDRSPLTDWYQTRTAREGGVRARPVIGGVFMPLLYDKALWQKYAGRDVTRAAHWAPMPQPPVMKIVVPTAREEAGLKWLYTTDKPADDWFQPAFKPARWKEGVAGFGTEKTPGAVVRTVWKPTTSGSPITLPAGPD